MLEEASRRLSACWHCVKRLKSAPHTNDDGYGQASPRLHTAFDITSVGLAISVPVGVYVTSAQVVKDLAGPAAILAILVSGIATALSGVCYAELRSRNHRVHSGTYEYLYRTCGEAVAFLAGWSLFLHHVTSASMVAKSISQNFDYMLDGRIQNLTVSRLGRIAGAESYLDFTSFFVVLITMVMMSAGIKTQHRWLNLILNCVSCILLLFLLVVSLYHLDFTYWKTPAAFFPGGGRGVFAGACLFTYALSGYESMLKLADFTTRGIRKPMVWSSALAYGLLALLLLGVSSSVSLLCPSTALLTDAPLSEAFSLAGLGWVRYLVDPAIMLTLTPVVLYHFVQAVSQVFQLSDDGLVFRTLSRVSDGAETPLVAAVLPGVVGSVLALVLPLTSLLEASAFTFLVSQTVCSVAILQLRYRPSAVGSPEHKKKRGKYLKRKKMAKSQGGAPSTPVCSYSAGYGAAAGGEPSSSGSAGPQEQPYVQLNGITSPVHAGPNGAACQEPSSSDTDIDDVVEEYHDIIRVRAASEDSPLPAAGRTQPTSATHQRSAITIALFLGSSICSAAILTQGTAHLASGQAFVVLLLVAFLLLALLSAVFLSRQPVDHIDSMFLVFEVPVLPWIPILSIFLNVNMILLMQPLVWLIVFLWFLLGAIIYLAYGLSHSNEAQFSDFLPEEQRVLLPFAPMAHTDALMVGQAGAGARSREASPRRVAPVTRFAPVPGFVGQDGNLISIDTD